VLLLLRVRLRRRVWLLAPLHRSPKLLAPRRIRSCQRRRLGAALALRLLPLLPLLQELGAGQPVGRRRACSCSGRSRALGANGLHLPQRT
jgi:hypothetical protein